MPMTDTELQQLIERAAEAGAKRALGKVGLHDDTAGDDVKELRSLLDSWRETKRTITQTVARTITTALLGALALGVWFSYWPKGK
jgi:hypothetical protein